MVNYVYNVLFVQVKSNVIVSTSELRANLSNIIERAKSGETIVVTSNSKPVIQLEAYKEPQGLDSEALAEFRKNLPKVDINPVLAAKNEYRA